MALLLETNLGDDNGLKPADIVIDLDLEGSPNLCRSVLKLAKMRYYTSNLIFNIVQPYRFCQMGDPTGTGRGGSCIDGVLDVAATKLKAGDEKLIITSEEEENSTKRFLKTSMAGRQVLSSAELRKRGKVVCTELMGVPDTIGSQFSIFLGNNEEGHGMDGYYSTNSDNNNDLDGNNTKHPTIISLGQVMEDDAGVLTKLERAYCDSTGRPYADIRIQRVLVLHDPFEDPSNLIEYLRHLPNTKFTLNTIADSITTDSNLIVSESPNLIRPHQEKIPERISADQITIHNDDDDEGIDDAERQRRIRKEAEEVERRRDHSRAVVLELVGDLPDANIKVPDHILFICKLNRHTQEEDLELIFSRFDSNVKVDLIRDEETGDSLQYAFAEFSTKEQCTEAYFKMDNALVDDRRIKVDFSQSVAKLWKKRYYGGNDKEKKTNNNRNRNNKRKGDYEQPGKNYYQDENRGRNNQNRKDHRYREEHNQTLGRQRKRYDDGDERYHHGNRRGDSDNRYQEYPPPHRDHRRRPPYHEDYHRNGRHHRYDHDSGHYHQRKERRMEDESFRRNNNRDRHHRHYHDEEDYYHEKEKGRYNRHEREQKYHSDIPRDDYNNGDGDIHRSNRYRGDREEYHKRERSPSASGTYKIRNSDKAGREKHPSRERSLSRANRRHEGVRSRHHQYENCKEEEDEDNNYSDHHRRDNDNSDDDDGDYSEDNKRRRKKKKRKKHHKKRKHRSRHRHRRYDSNEDDDDNEGHDEDSNRIRTYDDEKNEKLNNRHERDEDYKSSASSSSGSISYKRKRKQRKHDRNSSSSSRKRSRQMKKSSR